MWLLQSQQGTESYSSMDIAILCDTTSWIPSFLPYSIGYKQIPGLTSTQGAGITQAWKIRDRGPWGILESETFKAAQEWGFCLSSLSSLCILLLHQAHVSHPFCLLPSF